MKNYFFYLKLLKPTSFTSRTSKFIRNYFSSFNTRRNIYRLKNHSFSAPSLIHITSSGISHQGKYDGGCSQILRQISAIAFTKEFGFNYIHTPLTSVTHNYRDDSEWTKKWENIFQLSKFSNVNNDVNIKYKQFETPIDLIPTLLKENKNKINQYYHVCRCHAYLNRNITTYQQIRTQLRSNYQATERNPNLIYDETILNIAIHVRRGDVQVNRNAGRYTSSEKLMKVIRQIKSVLGANKFNISIFCIEKQSDLEELKSNNIQIIYNLDIFDVLDHLIHADVLVTSKSTVSYIPAIINNGVIIYESFWNEPFNDWLDIEKDFRGSLKDKLTILYPNKFTS